MNAELDSRHRACKQAIEGSRDARLRQGFELGQLVDQFYNPPSGDEPDDYIEGWVDGRMEQIRYEDPTTADKFEAIFLGAEGFGKATYRDMLNFLTADDETIARRLEQAGLR